jgi:hypothetical protein
VTQIPLISLRLQRTLLSVAMLCGVMSKSGKDTLLAARYFYLTRYEGSVFYVGWSKVSSHSGGIKLFSTVLQLCTYHTRCKFASHMTIF